MQARLAKARLMASITQANPRSMLDEELGDLPEYDDEKRSPQ
jgi:hypothetical protein